MGWANGDNSWKLILLGVGLGYATLYGLSFKFFWTADDVSTAKGAVGVGFLYFKSGAIVFLSLIASILLTGRRLIGRIPV